MAALRHGIRTVIIPKENERDLNDIDPVVRRSLNFITAETVNTVLNTALNRKPEDMIPSILNNLPDEMKNKSRKNGLRQ